MKRPALHNKQVGVLRMAFQARKVFGTFEKRTAFSGPARAITYGPHTGIFSILFQWKRARGRTGHIITLIYRYVACEDMECIVKAFSRSVRESACRHDNFLFLFFVLAVVGLLEV